MAHGKCGIALAGGGPVGAIYEIGALVALDEALIGLDLSACDVYVGVSSGGFFAAGLANGMTPRDLYRVFIETEAAHNPFEPNALLLPAVSEYLRCMAAAPELFAGALRQYLSAPLTLGFFESFQKLARSLPTGIFDNSRLATWLAEHFSAPGRTNDFRELSPQIICGRDRSRRQRGRGFRLTWLGRRADLPGGSGEFGSAGTVSAGRYSRPPICGRRLDEDVARVRRLEGRRRSAVLYQSTRSLRRQAGHVQASLSTGIAGRRRPSGRALANLPVHYPLAHADRHGSLSPSIPEGGHCPVRTERRRRRHVLHQRLQLFQQERGFPSTPTNSRGNNCGGEARS